MTTPLIVQVLLSVLVLVLQHIFSTTFDTLHAEEGYNHDRTTRWIEPLGMSVDRTISFEMRTMIEPPGD